VCTKLSKMTLLF